ncbi:hypothetical protein GCM10023259_101880 [Thermocatellispora tengchongensis]
MDDSLGSSYHLRELIGEGAMGAVWRAVDKRSGEHVAAKLLHGRLLDDPDIVARFVQERTVLLRLRHPGIVAIRDFVIEGGRIAIVMDLVEGSDLGRHLRELGTLTAERALGVAIQLGEALAAAHATGIVHRDVKPGNVLVDGETVKLTDFGVARILQGAHAAPTTTVVGTPNYMPPEVIEGAGPHPSADVYALGMVLYELLAGRAPFSAGHHLSPLHCAFHMVPRRLPGMADDVWAVIEACTAKNPANRPPMTEVVARLRAALPGARVTPRLTPIPRTSPLQLTALPVEQRPPAAPVPPPAAPKKWRPRTGMVIGAVAVLAAVTTVVVTAMRVVEFGPARSAAAEDTVTPTPPPAKVSTPPVALPVQTPDVVDVEPAPTRTGRKQAAKRTPTARPTPPPSRYTPKPTPTRTRKPTKTPSPDKPQLLEPVRPDNLKCREPWLEIPAQGIAMRPCIRIVDNKPAVVGQVRGRAGVVTDIQIELWDATHRRTVAGPFRCIGVKFTADGQVKTCGWFAVDGPSGAEYQGRQRWRKTDTGAWNGGAQSLGIRW